MFCSACGAANEDGARFCQACGVAMATGYAAPPPTGQSTMRGGPATRVVSAAPTGKNPAVAAILSVIIVGLGQFYNGDMKKGAIMLAIAVVLGIPTLGLVWLGIAIWSAVDAYQVASGTGRMW